jgi:hypothetical protein
MLCWNVRTMYTSIIFEDTNSTEQGYIKADEKYLLKEQVSLLRCYLQLSYWPLTEGIIYFPGITGFTLF